MHTCQAAVLSDAATHEESAPISARPDSFDAGAAAAAVAAAAPHARNRLVVSPDDLVLEPGELSVVDRPGCNSPADVFRCPSCTELACQVLAMCPRKPPLSPKQQQQRQQQRGRCVLLSLLHGGSLSGASAARVNAFPTGLSSLVTASLSLGSCKPLSQCRIACRG